MAVSKRLRYEVLKRDGYRCYYCGTTAGEAKLVVDAVVPEALGGSHKDPANLRAACDPCNNGKSSSSPDAPLVAAVAEDAARWAQAMNVAQGHMLADLDARERDREQFTEWWDAWTYGSGDQRSVIPRDPGWEHTVDRLLSAGLPLRILKGCIDLAMSHRKVKPENTFRYMCDIAWNKVSELQEMARSSAPPGAGPSDGSDWCEFSEAETQLIQAGRHAMAVELLSELTEVDREIALDEIRSLLGDDGEVAILAASAEFCGAIRDRQQLTEAVEWFLERHPDGALYLEQADTHLRDVAGSFLRRELIRVAAIMLMRASQPSEVTT